MSYLKSINELYPVRKTTTEKEQFRQYVIEEVEKAKQGVTIEVFEQKHHNIIIGNLERAKVIFTAHYDTPAMSLIPNLIMPRNLVFCYFYHFGYPILLALISLLIAVEIKNILAFNQTLLAIVYIAIYLFLFILCNRTFKNKHNANDNTSGVALILELIKRKNQEDVAYILFDNEEKGLLGSKALNKKYHDILDQKLIINLDCIGVGNNVIIIHKEDACKLTTYKTLKTILKDTTNYRCFYYPKKTSSCNSDYKNFKCGVGIMTCKKAKILGFYTWRIHTNFDTIASEENIEFIADSLETFINEING